MIPLDTSYNTRLEDLAEQIQNSDELTQYLDTEELEDFKALQATFEPVIDDLHAEIAEFHPLQQEAFEVQLLDPKFEGLHLPRILGYCVLRGELNEKFKYIRPQNHFKKVLLGICNSSNFEVLKTRIGQTLKIGFSLSSDIWSTNLIQSIKVKSARYFLEQHKNEAYRSDIDRKSAYLKLKKQYQSLNFTTTTFPNTELEVRIFAPSLKSFLLSRATSNYENKNIVPSIMSFIQNKDFRNSKEYLELIMIIGMSFDLTEDQKKDMIDAFEDMKENYRTFEEDFFNILDKLYDIPEIHVANSDKRFAQVVDRDWGKELNDYYEVIDDIHTKGYMHEEVIDAVRTYYYNHEGRSSQNECLRKVVFSYFGNFLLNLDTNDFTEFFTVFRTMITYIGIFDNQKFNQGIKKYSLLYIKRLLKAYTDKRARDYQDIKKFTVSNFLELKFMKEKELKDLFKTKRKKAATS